MKGCRDAAFFYLSDAKYCLTLCHLFNYQLVVFMKQPYVGPEVQVYSLALEMGILSGGSNEGFDSVTPGTWDSISTSSLDEFLNSDQL